MQVAEDGEAFKAEKMFRNTNSLYINNQDLQRFVRDSIREQIWTASMG